MMIYGRHPVLGIVRRPLSGYYYDLRGFRYLFPLEDVRECDPRQELLGISRGDFVRAGEDVLQVWDWFRHDGEDVFVAVRSDGLVMDPIARLCVKVVTQ